MIVGFTGSRKRITDAQRAALRDLLVSLQPISTAHHGDAIGADAVFHEICRELCIPLNLHPPTDPKHRAFCQASARIHPEKAYLLRNQDIVDAADILLATPSGFRETLRSGTWATVRYARKKQKPVYVIRPDGHVVCEPRS